jgi:hypothetical protein
MGTFGLLSMGQIDSVSELCLFDVKRNVTYIFEVNFNQTGEHLKDIVFSGKCLTCPTWGGDNFDMMFVTSAQDTDGYEKDEGGHIFCYKDDKARGVAKNIFPG